MASSLSSAKSSMSPVRPPLRTSQTNLPPVDSSLSNLRVPSLANLANNLPPLTTLQLRVIQIVSVLNLMQETGQSCRFRALVQGLADGRNERPALVPKTYMTGLIFKQFEEEKAAVQSWIKRETQLDYYEKKYQKLIGEEETIQDSPGSSRRKHRSEQDESSKLSSSARGSSKHRRPDSSNNSDSSETSTEKPVKDKDPSKLGLSSQGKEKRGSSKRKHKIETEDVSKPSLSARGSIKHLRFPAASISSDKLVIPTAALSLNQKSLTIRTRKIEQLKAKLYYESSRVRTYVRKKKFNLVKLRGGFGVNWHIADSPTFIYSIRRKFRYAPKPENHSDVYEANLKFANKSRSKVREIFANMTNYELMKSYGSFKAGTGGPRSPYSAFTEIVKVPFDKAIEGARKEEETLALNNNPSPRKLKPDSVKVLYLDALFDVYDGALHLDQFAQQLIGIVQQKNNREETPPSTPREYIEAELENVLNDMIDGIELEKKKKQWEPDVRKLSPEIQELVTEVAQGVPKAINMVVEGLESAYRLAETYYPTESEKTLPVIKEAIFRIKDIQLKYGEVEQEILETRSRSESVLVRSGSSISLVPIPTTPRSNALLPTTPRNH